MIRVLYIHHSGVFGGASRSLLELIKSFPENAIEPTVLLPEGSAADALRKQHINTIISKGISQFDNTSYGHYKGFRWLVLLREILLLPGTYFSIRKCKKQLNTIDIIHVNEITNLPAVILASKVLKKPIVLHIRSLQRSSKGFRNKIIYRLISKFVVCTISIDKTVANSLPENFNTQIIHNGFDPLSNINGSGTVSEQILKKLTGKLKVVTVGNILFMKGIEEFVRAAALAKANNLLIDFIIVGDKPAAKKGVVQFFLKLFGLSHDAKQFVVAFVAEHKLQDFVHLVTFTPNITSIYKNIDILCFPSHLNAVGRPVFEAAFLKKPSIVAIRNPVEDTIVDMETGICIEEKSPTSLFNAIKFFYDNSAEVARMGENSYNLAKRNFDIKENALKVLKLYNNILAE